jgi:hypothetical protein
MSSKKSGHFWELEAWMREWGVSARELGVLTNRNKNTICHLLTGQFMRIDPTLQRDIKIATKGIVGEKAWTAFIQRRLDMRMEIAA